MATLSDIWYLEYLSEILSDIVHLKTALHVVVHLHVKRIQAVVHLKNDNSSVSVSEVV